MLIPVDQLTPNPDQPRRDFDAAAMQELAASIREKGVIQPLLVRPHPHRSGQFEIVAGERRWRAAQMAQLHEVPALLRDLTDSEVIEVAIIENIQRADLNPVEEALGYKLLMERFGHTQEKMAEALSKSRSHIANLLRLLQLPDEVQGWLREGRLTAGHARALITTPDPTALAAQVIAKGLSVREAERLAKRAQAGLAVPPKQRPQKEEKDADTRALERDLSVHLRMRVAINHLGHDGGNVVITYRDLDQLDRLCQILSTMP
jgi:ParB family chromosome partitioning protein